MDSNEKFIKKSLKKKIKWSKVETRHFRKIPTIEGYECEVVKGLSMYVIKEEKGWTPTLQMAGCDKPVDVIATFKRGPTRQYLADAKIDCVQMMEKHISDLLNWFNN